MLPIACQLWPYRQILGRAGLVSRLDQVLGQISAAGFRGVQHFLDCVSKRDLAHQFATLLDKHRLQPAGIYAAGPMHDPKRSERFEDQLLNAVALVRAEVPLRSLTLSADAVPGQTAKTDEQLHCQAQTFIHISQELAGEGMRLIYHYRASEMADRAREFKRMMHLTNLKHMGLCFDPDAAAKAGMIPGDLADQFAYRIQETQLRSRRDGVLDQMLDDGDIELADLIELLDDYEFHGWHVVALAREPDTPKTVDLPEALTRSYAYARALLTV